MRSRLTSPGSVCFLRAYLIVCFAVVRSMANAWTTTRRVGSRPGRCLWGCPAVGGDDFLHYISCPLLGGALRQGRFRVPCWAHNGHVRLALLVAPLSDADTCCAAAWLYIAHLLFAAAKHAPRAWCPARFRTAFRAAVRSALVRLPALRDHLLQPRRSDRHR